MPSDQRMIEIHKLFEDDVATGKIGSPLVRTAFALKTDLASGECRGVTELSEPESKAK
jgi:hypothetical protein